ncbi:MAG: hypothetical protein HON65_12000 [Rhodospirillales bacterium]|jgi:flagellar hook-length control protein FliK|nr:hypothetical protein [Rhodospirillales bacterium]
MDVQKITALANAAANTKSQTSGNILEGVSMLASSFSKMIRMPMAQHNVMFANNDQNVVAESNTTEAQKQNNTSERKEADDKPYRVENNDRSSQNDDARDNVADTKQADSYSSDGQDDTPDHKQSNDSDEPAARENNHKQASDDNQNSDDNETVQSAEATSADQNNNGNTDSGDNELIDYSIGKASELGTQADGFVILNEGIAGAAQINAGEQSTKDTSQVLREVVGTPGEAQNMNAANPLAEKSGGPTNQQNMSHSPEAQGQQANLGNTPEEIITNDQVQKILRAVSRLGVEATPKDITQAAKTMDVPLSEQQAKMLSDSLKLNRPVNINVNVNKSAEAAVSQTTQSLTSNAIAAQAMETGSVIQKGNSAASLSALAAQTAGNSGEAQGMTHGQAQAANQLANTNANVSADQGIAKAVSQVTSSGPQNSVDGPSATTQPGSTQTQQSANMAKAQQTQTSQAPEQNRPLSHQISVNITKAIASGMDKITVQLRPDNLGRVEVKLEVGSNGKVSATIIADRPETIELLRNDSRNLEKALQDAGLDANANDLNFSLRDQNENSGESQSDSQMAEEEDDTELEMQDGTPEAELATRLLNGELDQMVEDARVDIRA